MLIETCPICGKKNCFETNELSVSNITYYSVKCKECNNIIASCGKEERDYYVEERKKRAEHVERIQNLMEHPNNQDKET